MQENIKIFRLTPVLIFGLKNKQAKRYKSKVGIKAVQEAVASKGYYKCDRAMVVANNYFTNQARTLASRNKVELWDRKSLVKNLLQIKNHEEP